MDLVPAAGKAVAARSDRVRYPSDAEVTMATAIDRRSFLASLAALGITACTRTAPRTFPELLAAGAPGDLGLAQGRAFADRIRSNLEFYLD